MVRLLDANVFIEAKNTYYGLDLVPAFWDWLGRDLIFRIQSSSEGVAEGVARLGGWAQGEGYRPHVLADFMDGADPFLVAAAAEAGATVVTQETPAGSRRKKVKIPDACRHLGVPFENTFEMMRSLGARFG